MFVITIKIGKFEPEYLTSEDGCCFRLDKSKALQFNDKATAERHIEQLLGENWADGITLSGGKVTIEIAEVR